MLDIRDAIKQGVSGGQGVFRIETDDGGAVSGWQHAVGYGLRVETPDSCIRPARREEVEAAGLAYIGEIHEGTMGAAHQPGAHAQLPGL